MGATAIRLSVGWLECNFLYSHTRNMYSRINIIHSFVHCTIHVVLRSQFVTSRSTGGEDVEFIYEGVNKCAEVGFIDDRPFGMGIV